MHKITIKLPEEDDDSLEKIHQKFILIRKMTLATVYGIKKAAPLTNRKVNDWSIDELNDEVCRLITMGLINQDLSIDLSEEDFKQLIK